MEYVAGWKSYENNEHGVAKRLVKYVNLKFYHIQVKQRTPVYKSYELIFLQPYLT